MNILCCSFKKKLLKKEKSCQDVQHNHDIKQKPKNSKEYFKEILKGHYWCYIEHTNSCMFLLTYNAENENLSMINTVLRLSTLAHK